MVLLSRFYYGCTFLPFALTQDFETLGSYFFSLLASKGIIKSRKRQNVRETITNLSRRKLTAHENACNMRVPYDPRYTVNACQAPIDQYSGNPTEK